MVIYAAVIIGALAGIAGAVIGGVSASKSAKAQKKMSQYQADVANQQAILAQRQADQNSALVQLEAQRETKQLHRKYMILEGIQKAARAASGLGGGSVTEGDIATDTFRTKTLDEIAIRYNADLKSWDLKQHAGLEVWGLGNQANMYGMEGRYAQMAGNYAVAGSIISGVGSTAGGVAGAAGAMKTTPTKTTNTSSPGYSSYSRSTYSAYGSNFTIGGKK